MKTVYIAGAFRADDHWTMAQNIHKAREYGMEVMLLGAVAIIPHSMFSAFHGTITEEFWIKVTKKLLRMCDSAFFMPGWQSSDGAQGEWDDAGDRGQPRFERLTDLKAWLQDGVPSPA